MYPLNLRKLSRRIREAIAWCDPRADLDSPVWCLRTIQLHVDTSCMDHSKVEDVATERGKRLGRRAPARADGYDEEPIISKSEMGAGRILVFEPDIYLHEAWEQDQSRGFLDQYCIPPGDTWLDFVFEFHFDRGGVLLSWVPARCVPLAQAAISINTTCCLRWIHEVDEPWAEPLRAALQL